MHQAAVTCSPATAGQHRWVLRTEPASRTSACAACKLRSISAASMSNSAAGGYCWLRQPPASAAERHCARRIMVSVVGHEAASAACKVPIRVHLATQCCAAGEEVLNSTAYGAACTFLSAALAA